MAEQLSVFIQNEPGKIASITQTLADANVDIRALSIADTADFGVLRMLVTEIDKAREQLEKQRCIVSVTNVTVVAVPDVPGGLARVLTLLNGAKVDIEYMYSLFAHETDKAYMVFRVSDEKKLHEVLRQNGIETVTGEELGLN